MTDEIDAELTAAMQSIGRSRQMQKDAELIAELKVNLAEALKLNEEFEDDLRVAVQCMKDCEDERVAQVRRLEAEIDGLHNQLLQSSRQQRYQHQQQPQQQKQQQQGFVRTHSLADEPSEAYLARNRLQEHATELVARSTETKFRHMNSLTRRDVDADDGNYNGNADASTYTNQRHEVATRGDSMPPHQAAMLDGVTTEVTLRLRLPNSRRQFYEPPQRRAQAVPAVPPKIPASATSATRSAAAASSSRSRSKSPLSGSTSTHAPLLAITNNLNGNPDVSLPNDGQHYDSSTDGVPPTALSAAASERMIRQLQLEVVHLRQRIAMLNHQHSGSGRSGSPTSINTPTSPRGGGSWSGSASSPGYNAARARLAQAVQSTLVKGLVRAGTDAKDLRAAIAGLETRVRRRQVGASNAGASFAPLLTHAEGLAHLLDNLRQDGTAILRNNCITDELLHAGAVAAGSTTTAAATNDGAASTATGTSASRAVQVAPRASGAGAASAPLSVVTIASVGGRGGQQAGFVDPTDPTSPKWVLVDARTVRIAPNAAAVATAASDAGSQRAPSAPMIDGAEDSTTNAASAFPRRQGSVISIGSSSGACEGGAPGGAPPMSAGTSAEWQHAGASTGHVPPDIDDDGQ